MSRDAAPARSMWRGAVAGSSAALLAAVMIPCVASAQVDVAMKALDRKDCEAVIDALNRGTVANEARAYYVTGLLYESGTCLKADPAKAVPVYERGAELGDTSSAMALALLGATGAGAAPSYPLAGYWFAVARLGKAGAAARGDASYATPDAVAHTYVETVHAYAERNLVYPADAFVQGVRGKVVMRFDPRSGDVTVVSSQDNQGMSMNHLGPGKRGFERTLRAAYADAIKALPKPTLPAGGDLATEHEVRFDRDRSSGAGPNSLQDIRR